MARLTWHLPQLCLITPDGASLSSAATIIEQAIAGGVTMIQIRSKSLPNAQRFQLARIAQEIAQGRAIILYNGALSDLPHLSCPSIGLHFSDGHSDIEHARAVLGPQALFGVSIHDQSSALQAADAGASYLLFGNVFTTASHPGRSGQGIQALAALCQAVSCPVLAVGGIIPERVPQVCAAGASGIAVISYIWQASAPRHAATELINALHVACRHHFPFPHAHN